MKFATKLTVLISLIVGLFVLPVSYSVYTSSISSLEHNIIIRLEDTAHHILDKIDRTLFERLADIKTIAGDPVIRSTDSSPKAVRKRLIEYRNSCKTYISLSLFDVNRERITDTAGLDIGKRHALEGYWKNSPADKFVMDVAASSSLNRAVMHFAYPVKNKNEVPTGVVVSRVPINNLFYAIKSTAGMQAELEELEELKVDLFDKNGLLLYSNHNRKGILKDVFDITKCRQNPLEEEENNIGRCFHEERGKELCVTVREHGYLDFKGNGWVLIMHIPEDVVFAPARQLRNRLVVIVCALFFISMIVVMLFSRAVSKPIAELQKGAEIIGTGNLDYRVGTSSKDEIGLLSRTFDKMSQQLKEITASRKELNNEIIEREQIEAQLEVERNRFKNIVETNPNGIYIVNRQHSIEYINPVIEQEFGTVDERKCYEYFHDRTESCPWCKIDEVFAGKTVRWEWYSKKNNRYYELFDTPLKNADGSISKFEMFYDITDRKQAEENLRQSQKMESVGTLAGGVAHEFNNILGGITGYTEIAIDDAHEDSPVRESLDEILKLSNRARDVVKQILSFSRKGKKEFKSIQPHLIIEDSLKVLRATIPTTIEIKHNLDANSGTILADPTQINQVGTNLCMNAAHAMEESGGVLEIGLSPVVLDAEDVKPCPDLETGEYVKLTVSDTGTGIDPNNIGKIFDPFFTTKGVGKGTGMGLSVVHGIIKDHGGEITVSSKLGEGTTFTVFLPKVESKSEETKIEDAIPTGTENILVVDDEEHMVFLTKTILGRLGYKVTALTNSLEALNIFKKDPQRYDLIITDLTMPHLTGDRLASEIIAIRPDMPVIIATGYADALESEKVKQSGIKAFIPKPCQKQDLAKTIRLILDEK